MVSEPVLADPKIAAFTALRAELGSRIVTAEPVLHSGFSEVDRALGGGLPRGALCTVEGAESSGRMAFAAHILAQGARDGLVAVVDDGGLYPPDLVRAGVALERMLVVPAAQRPEIARAADILLRARAFGIVLMPALLLRAVQWSRLTGLAHKAGAVLLVLGRDAGTELAHFASARLQCAMEGVTWHSAGPFGELRGYEVCVRVLKSRFGRAGTSVRVRAVA